MIKSIGEMRTRVTIQKIQTGQDREGFNTREYIKIFPGPIWCKWEWERGTETFENERQRLEERAVITVRYTDKITQRCMLWKEKDKTPWEIVAINDIDDRHRWLQITLKRSVKA